MAWASNLNSKSQQINVNEFFVFIKEQIKWN